MKNIVLVGFMGTGKTAVAKLISERLKMPYVSTDEIVERVQKSPISEIFSKWGEDYFRRLERQAAKEASSLKGAVIDTGGGIVTQEENIKNLKENGVVVCLTASPEVILRRTKGYAHRPLLNTPDPKKKIEELLALRAPYYAKADFIIDTSDITVEEVAKKIEDAVR